jgi:inositol-phosphate transport system ATP-binding protein
MARVDLVDLRKAWGDVVAVEGMSLAIEDGEFVAILGPSGCGKSTTLFMLAGIYAPTSGELKFDGRVVNEVEARDRNVGIVFQSHALYPHMNVRRNIMFPLKFKGVKDDDARRRAGEAARLVHVEEWSARPRRCRAGSSSASPWSRSRSCCYWTSRSPISMRRCA